MDPILLHFVNETDGEIKIFWHDYSGVLRQYHTLQPNQSVSQSTYATHPWSATSFSGFQVLTGDARVFVPEAGDNEATLIIRREAEVDEGE